MKIIIAVLVVLLTLPLAGCSSSFWGGTATGALGAGAGYEVHAESEMRKLDEDLKSGKITQQEYDIRKDQLKKDSLLK